MATNVELIKLKRVLDSSLFAQDIKLGWKTFGALKKVKQLVDAEVEILGEAETKYLEERAKDVGFQKYFKGLDAFKDEAGELQVTPELVAYRDASKDLINEHEKRTAEFEAYLSSDSDLELNTLKQDEHADFYKLELASEVWDALSPVLDLD